MAAADYLIFFAYLLGVLAMGAAFRRSGRSGREFFLASRSMRWFPIGLSVMVTVFSAVNYVALTGEVAGHGLYVLAALPVFVLVAFPVTRLLMPFFARMELTSAYEYLERRFDVRVRTLASGLFVLWRVMWMAVALFASGKILALATGLPLPAVLLIGGLAATAYTAVGGIRAVMWTDVAQFFVLFGGIVLGVSLAAGRYGGFEGLFATAHRLGRLEPISPWDEGFLSPDPRIRITLWSSLIGVSVAFLARYGADQMVIQRYFTARSLRDAQRGFWWNVVASVVSLSLLSLLGLGVLAHAESVGLAGGKPPPAKLLAEFVRSLPVGATGLIAAGLLAATMSSIDSGINACSAAYVTDFHQRLLAPSHTTPPVWVDRVLTLALGAAATGLSLLVMLYLGGKGGLFELVNRVLNGLGSPLLALFLLGMFSRRANAAGVLVGGILGTAWSVWVSFFVENLALQYYAVANLLGTMAAAYACSLIAAKLGGANSPAQLAWRWPGPNAQSP